jgi:hypothetical protein
MNSIFQLGSGSFIATAFAAGLLCLGFISADGQLGAQSASTFSAAWGSTSGASGADGSSEGDSGGTTTGTSDDVGGNAGTSEWN